jgi:hypothetical protein
VSTTTQERNGGDVALFLYAAPFIVSFGYALYLWLGVGLSSTLPALVYVEVSQSPYVFLVGFLAVLVASVVDLNAEPPEKRRSAVGALSRRLQVIAFLSIFLTLVTAWYAAGFGLGGALLNLLEGRYALIFPALLFFFSFLILPSFKMQGVNRDNLLVIVLLVASPAALYELGKRNTAIGLGAGLILLLVAAYLLVRPKKG